MPPVRPAAGEKITKTVFQIGSEEIDCLLIFSKKRQKTLSYTIRCDATDNGTGDDILSSNKPVLFVRAPDSMSAQSVLSLLSDNKANLITLLEKAQQKEKVLSEKSQRKYTNGSIFHYLGRTYSLQLIFENTKKISVHLLDGHLYVHLPEKMSALPENERESKIKKAIDAFYIEQADIYFNARADYFSKKYLQLLGKMPTSVQTTFYKTKWGCCTYDNHIKLNWVLIQADTRIIDYIIVHELSHIRYKDHSSHFWTLVESIDPNYKEKRLELKENGWILGMK